MVSLDRTLALLLSRRIEAVVEGDRVVTFASRDAIDDELATGLRSQAPTIVAFLRSRGVERIADLSSDRELFAVDEEPWCRFVGGSLACANDPCLNPAHDRPVSLIELKLPPSPLADLPCIACGAVGRSRVTGLCLSCRGAS